MDWNISRSLTRLIKVMYIFRDMIFIPGKREYVLSKDKDIDCIFCKAFRDPDHSGVKILFINDKVMIALNKYPYNPGHIMVAPYRHVEKLTELRDNEICYLFRKVNEATKLLEEVYSPPGFNIGVNMGEYSGASIRHLHVHVVPRYKSESGFLETISGTRIIVEDLDQTYNILIKHVDKLND